MVVGKKGLAIGVGGIVAAGTLYLLLRLRRRLRERSKGKPDSHRRHGWSDQFLVTLSKVRESLKIWDENTLEVFDDKFVIVTCILDLSNDDKAAEEICNALLIAMEARNVLWGLSKKFSYELAENILEKQEAILVQEMKLAASCKLYVDSGLDAVYSIMGLLRLKLKPNIKMAESLA